MSESDGINQTPPIQAPPIAAAVAGGASSAAVAAESPDSVRGMDPAARPAASGHRFGPDLACSECGIQWDAHQREPAPCAKEDASQVFLRRPAAEG